MSKKRPGADVLEPARVRPGVAGVRSLLVLNRDHSGHLRGSVVIAAYRPADELLDTGTARPATDADIATWGRAPLEI